MLESPSTWVDLAAILKADTLSNLKEALSSIQLATDKGEHSPIPQPEGGVTSFEQLHQYASNYAKVRDHNGYHVVQAC